VKLLLKFIELQLFGVFKCAVSADELCLFSFIGISPCELSAVRFSGRLVSVSFLLCLLF